MTNIKAILGLLLALVAAGAFAVTSAASDRSGTLASASSVSVGVVASGSVASQRSGTLKVYKECSEYTGRAGSFCTIKSSNLKEIKPGSKVFYLQPAALASNVILDPPGSRDDKAFGRCSLNKAGNGKCVFTRGTGALAGFRADLRVTHLGDPSASPFYYWQGRYSWRA